MVKYSSNRGWGTVISLRYISHFGQSWYDFFFILTKVYKMGDVGVSFAFKHRKGLKESYLLLLKGGGDKIFRSKCFLVCLWSMK